MSSLTTSQASFTSRGGGTKYNGGVLASGKVVRVVPTSATTFVVLENPADGSMSVTTVATITITTLKFTPRWQAVVGHDGTYVVLAYICSDNTVRSRIIRYTAGTGVSYVSTDAEQTAAPAVSGAEPDIMDIDVSVGGAVALTYLFSQSVSPFIGYVTRIRTTAGTWVAGETFSLETAAYPWRAWNTGINVSWSQGGGAAARRFDVMASYGGNSSDKGTVWRHCSINETTGASFSAQSKGLLPYGSLNYYSNSYAFSNRPRVVRGYALPDGLNTVIALAAIVTVIHPNDIIGDKSTEFVPRKWVGVLKTTTLGANAAADVVDVTMKFVDTGSYSNRKYNYSGTTAIGFNTHPDGSFIVNFIEPLYRPAAYSTGDVAGYDGVLNVAKIIDPAGSFTLNGADVASGRMNGTIEPQVRPGRASGDQLGDFWTTTQSPASGYPSRRQDWMSVELASGNNKVVFGNALITVTSSDLQPLASSVVTTSLPKVNVFAKNSTLQYSPPVVRPIYRIADNVDLTLNAIEFTDTFWELRSLSFQSWERTWKSAWVPAGVRYIGVKFEDPYGNQYTHPSVNTFTVSHPSGVYVVVPGYSTTDPGPVFYSDPNALGYSVHDISWAISDAFSEDYQTAYRLLVTDPLGSTVYDTGKVISQAVNSGTGKIRIPFANRNQNLTVTVYTWDVYDTSATPGSNARGSIIAYAGPNVTAVTASPLNASDLTAANPTITVTHTPGFRPSTALDVIISKAGVTLKTIHVDNPTNTQAVTFPSFLDNNTNYTVTAVVTDQGGLSHSLATNIHTLWTPPGAPIGVTVSAANYNTPNQNSIDISWSTNLLSGGDQEDAITPGPYGAGTLTWDTVESHSPTHSAKVVTHGAVEGAVFYTPTLLSANQKVVSSVWIKGPAGTTVGIAGRVGSVSGAYLGEGAGARNFVLTGAWQRIYTDPWTYATSEFQPWFQVTTSAAVTFWLDDAQSETGTVLTPWAPGKDANWIEWTIYRQINQINPETGAVLAYGDLTYIGSSQSNAPIVSYSDRTAPSGVQVGYVIRQKVNRSGSLIESVNNTPVVVNTVSEGYWLVDPDPIDPLFGSFQLYNVTSDNYSQKYESETMHLIGRGNHEDQGDYLGVEGSLVAKFRNSGGTTARQKKLRIEAIRSEARPLIMRTPFGDMFYVSIRDIEVDRIAGQGLNEFCDVTIPYSEVYR